MKHLYTYGLSLLVASSMAMATNITTTAPGYNLASNIALNVEGPLSGDQDWVGIYKKGSTNDWNNVLGWSWVEHPTEGLYIDTIRETNAYSGSYILSNGGEFEARIFFHNSYHAEASTPFYMTREDIPSLLIDKYTYQVGDTPQVKVNTVLSGDQDWVGIYPINSDNSWSNVIAWNWVESNGIVDVNKIRTGKELLAGEYEARLFFHNSYTVEASSNFNIISTGVVNYSEYGQYTASTPEKLYNKKIYIYKPKKNGIFRKNAPVVLYCTGGFGADISNSEPFIKYIVSKGYVVIGVSTVNDAIAEFPRVEGALNHLGNFIDKSKIGLIGSSTGGGRIFYQLRRLKELNYASTSFLLSLDGYAALGERVENVRQLDTTTLLLQFGGADGLDGNEESSVKAHNKERYQDPRFLMALYNILPGDEKSLSYLENKKHGYAGGSMNGKEDLLNVVGAMLAYKFENAGETARNIVLGNNKYDEIDNNKLSKDKYLYYCDEHAYKYCDVWNPTQTF